LNNRVVPPDQWSVREDGTVIALDFIDGLRTDENAIVLHAVDTKGHAGLFTALLSPATAPRSPRDEVIYYAMTDRFRNGNAANDPHLHHSDLHPLANYHGGDWAGVLEKVRDGYFDDLGVTTLWLSPPNANTMKIERDGVPPHRVFSSYHGYWPVSLEDTNTAFGTLEDLRALVDEAHDHGIAVILDFVANHVHEDHPLYQAHREWATPLELSNGEKNIRLFDTHPFTTWFDVFLPSLDYAGNPEALDIMTDNAVYWLEASGADGFRHDAVKHIPQSFWEDTTRKLTARVGMKRGAMLYQVGETISDRGTISRFVGPGLMTGQFDFPLLFTLQGAIARETGSMKDVAGALKASRDFYPLGGIMSPLIGNHDVSRFMGLADGDLPAGVDEKEVGFENPPAVDDPQTWRRMNLAFALLFAAPGPPTIYYGDEIGMTGAHDPDNRRSYPWENVSAEGEALREAVAELAAARDQSHALRRGRLEILHASDEFLAVARVASTETVIAVCFRREIGSSPVEFDLPACWGSGVRLEPLVSAGAECRMMNNRLSVTGGPYTYALVRVRHGN